jgi:uncharacterized protein
MSPFEILVADLRRSRAVEREIEVEVAVDWRLDLSMLEQHPGGTPNLRLELKLTPVIGGLLVHGTGTATARHTCHRCLNEWTEPMTVPISALFAEEADEDDEVFQLADTIDIETAVRDDVLVAMPLIPTCPDECSPQLVGAAENDLNTAAPAEDDSADGIPEDPAGEGSPFSVLRDFLDRGD